ncbi:TMEM175 family protein [Kitasatospora sp. NPDC059795]|uniref:TMEM175 family protein n=1 Tax=Kitasatospora sp. NPDC059795 TaxID=3346949 RepID=UPI00365A6E0C
MATDSDAAGTAPEGAYSSPGRLVALSDSVYAIALTLLVLNISVPGGLEHAQFTHALHDVWPRLGTYGLSFVVIAALWRDHRQIFEFVGRVDRASIQLTLASLGAVALLPFPTAMLSDYGGREPLVVTFYAATICAANLLHLLLFVRLLRHAPLRARAIPRRVVRSTAVDHAGTILIAAATAAVAWAVSPTAGLSMWLAALPCGLVARRMRRPW